MTRAALRDSRARLGAAAVVTLLTLALLCGCQGGDQPGGPPRPQNLIFITIDTLRADHVGCYGYARPTTPNIDKLAARSTLFEQASVPWPKTGPSVASTLTSTYPLTNRVISLRTILDERFYTLAEICRAHGLYTASFVANVHLGRTFGLDQGFDECHEMWRNTDRPLGSNTEADFFSNTEIATQVIDWLDRTTTEQKRFFVWVHFLDPHGPYLPPEDLKGRFTGDATYQQQEQPTPLERLPEYQRVGYQTIAEFIARYDEELLDTDRATGRILDRVQELGLDKIALIVLSSDHGESLGEHDYWMSHGQYLYQTCLHVPLLLSCPGVLPEGRRVPTPVGLIDLVPTVVDYLGMSQGEYRRQFQGASLRRLIEGRADQGEPVISQGLAGQLACRIGNHKYLFDGRPTSPEVPVLARDQLYDLAADPLETRNLWNREVGLAMRLKGALPRWQQRVRKQEAAFLVTPLQPTSAPVDEATRRRLEQLGYVEKEDGGP